MHKNIYRIALLLVALALLSVVFVPAQAQNEDLLGCTPSNALQLGTLHTANVQDGLRVRTLPSTAADVEIVEVLPIGTTVSIMNECVAEDGSLWVEHQYGWSAYNIDGTGYMYPATQAQANAFLAQASAQSAGNPVPTFVEQPVYWTNPDVPVGTIHSPQGEVDGAEECASVLIPEGGYIVTAEETDNGMWNVETHMGNAVAEGDNNIVEEFCYNEALNFIVVTVQFATDVEINLMARALAAELFDYNAVAVTIDEQGPFTALYGQEIDLVEDVDVYVAAVNNVVAVPNGANDWGTGYNWPISVSDATLPLDGNGFGIIAAGPHTFTVGELTRDVATEGNLIVIVVEDGYDSSVEVTGAAGAFSYTNVYEPGEERPQDGAFGNGNTVLTESCGGGCPSVTIYFVYVPAQGVPTEVHDTYTSANFSLAEVEALAAQVLPQQ